MFDMSGRVYDPTDVAPTIHTVNGGGQETLVALNHRVRKITERECWRLQGFDDTDFDKASKVCRKTQLYKQAGNSIAVNVLEAILKNLFPSEVRKSVYIFDCEVFAFDWLFVFKEAETGEHTIIHNDNEAIQAFMTPDKVLVGFNNKNYDNHILKAVLCGAEPQTVKEINDFIIGGHNGWEHPFIQSHKAYFESFDLMDDMQQGLSLKSIEAHLGIDIEETSVDFNIDRPLTEKEMQKTIFYCKYDVDATEILLFLRRNYLENKITLGRAKGIEDTRALYMTNAKLTAAYLDASKTEERTDERNYQYPDNLLRQYIPKDVFDFFDHLHDRSISDEEIFSSKYDFNIGKCECTIGYGGIHGAILCYREKSIGKRTIRNRDVASYYPHLMTLDGYCSRNIPNATIYADMLETRMQAKKAGDSATANALKLVANTTYGAMLNKFNELYDPLMGRSVCITGQLRLLEMALHLVADCPTLKIIQLNTDGIMVSLDEEDIPTYNAICQEWQDRTGFELEEDCISEIIQKDVNNYVEIASDGSSKIKGGQLVRGIVTNTKLDLKGRGIVEWTQTKGGAFNINNNAVIVAKAIKDFLASNIPVEETIGECNDLLSFQLIAKVSSKYTGAYQLIDGKEVPIQKVNRVYASPDMSRGTIYKIHAVKGNASKVAGLPEHCIIDNRNALTTDSIDKRWYIRLAKKYINDFLGIVIKKPNGRKSKAIEKKIRVILGVEAPVPKMKREQVEEYFEEGEQLKEIIYPDGFRLVNTSLGCPEQYDVFAPDGKQVGYLRLRFGCFKVCYPDSKGEIVYTAYPNGEGAFTEDERDHYLAISLKKIKNKMEETLYGNENDNH